MGVKSEEKLAEIAGDDTGQDGEGIAGTAFGDLAQIREEEHIEERERTLDGFGGGFVGS